MLIQRERRLASSCILMPAPAPLPNLHDALARRAAIFGPFDLDEAPEAPRGPAVALGALARRIVSALDLMRVS